MKLWLDDDRMPPDDTWVWCKSSHDAFIAMYRAETEKNFVTHISFDHDLGGGDEGVHVANYIELRASIGVIRRLKWRVHSDNPWRSRIVAAMEAADRFWERNERNDPLFCSEDDKAAVQREIANYVENHLQFPYEHLITLRREKQKK